MMPYDYTWSDFVGNIGVAILLTTYYLNVAGKIDSKGWQYNLANLFVAVLLGINLYYKPNISSIITYNTTGGGSTSLNKCAAFEKHSEASYFSLVLDTINKSEW